MLASLWVLELCRLALPAAPIRWVALPLFGLYLVIAALKASRLALLLPAALGLCAVAVALLSGRAFDLIAGLEKALVFTAFIPTLAWLRAAAERSPAIGASQAAFATMSGRERETGLMVGAHLLGAILTAGIFGLFAPLLPKNLPLSDRVLAAQAIVRGMCLAVLWSPCFVGMALAALGLVLADLMFGLRRPRVIWQATTRGFRPILPPLAIGAGSVVAVAGLTPLSSLDAVLSTLPPLGLVWLLASRPDQLGAAVSDTWQSLGRMGNDLLVISLAMVLAAALTANPEVDRLLGHVADLDLPPVALIGGTLGLIVGAGLLGLHPMVGISVLVPLIAGLPGTGVSEPVLLLVAVYGWAFGTLNSVSSLALVLAAASFRVPMERLVLSRNLAFALTFTAISTVLLGILNAFWMQG